MVERRDSHKDLVRKPEGKYHLVHPGLGWRKILRLIFGIGIRGIDSIDLAEERDRRWALVNAVMNFGVLQNAGNFLTS
jgi:hypothetical protein